MSENGAPDHAEEGGVSWAKPRLPFDAPGDPGASAKKRGMPLIYAIAVAATVGVALYMALVAGRPWGSPAVVAPLIGAGWFGLRLFMMWSKK